MLRYSAWAVLSLYSTRVFASTADLILCLRSKHVREQRDPMNLEIFSRCRNRHESKQKFLSTPSIDRLEFARNSQSKCLRSANPRRTWSKVQANPFSLHRFWHAARYVYRFVFVPLQAFFAYETTIPLFLESSQYLVRCLAN